MKTIPARSQAFGEIGILGKKAIAGVDRIRALSFGRLPEWRGHLR